MIKDDVILLIELLTKCHFNLLITGGVINSWSRKNTNVN